MSTPGPDYEEAIKDFWRGGWLTALFGGAGMLARMLVTDTTSPLIWWVRRIMASVVVGVLSYFALWNADIPGLYKAVILTTSGMACPEIIEGIVNRYNKELKNGKKKNKRGN